MAAIPPEEAGKLSGIELEELNNLEIRINSVLRVNYDLETNAPVTYDIVKEQLSTRMARYLKRSYEKAGWQVDDLSNAEKWSFNKKTDQR